MHLGMGSQECIRESLGVDQGIPEGVQWIATEMVTCSCGICREAELGSFSLEKAKRNPYRCLDSQEYAEETS